MDTLRFLRSRLAQLIPLLFGISIVVFLLLRMIPGDPAVIMLGTYATPEALSELRGELGLDKPIWEQYLVFMQDAVRGDLGRSISLRRPVLQVILEKLPVTLFLVGYSVLLSLLIAIPLSLLAGLKRGSFIDQIVRGFVMISLAVPGFWLGLNLILIFAVQYRLFPVGGVGRDFTAWPRNLFLPSLTIALSIAAMLTRNLRSAIIDVLQAPYVEFARAKGVRKSVILTRHVLRNALISTVTILGLNIGWLIGGSVVVETVFSIPGMGLLVVNSIYARDYPVVQGLTLVFGVLVILINLLTDLTYSILDPRVSYD